MWSGGTKPRAHKPNLTSILLAMAVAVCAVGCVGVCPSVALAVGSPSTVKVSLRDDAPASLSILAPASGATVGNNTVTIEGTVHNVGQIMAYLDGAYYSTFPLDTGVETFSLPIMVSVGAHTIKLVGIDGVTNTQAEATLDLTYVVHTTDTPGGTVAEEVGAVAEHVGGAVIGAGNNLKSQINDASGAGPMKTFTDTAFNALRALDLVPVTPNDSFTAMTARVAIVSAGLVLTAMPWTVYAFLAHIKLLHIHAVLSPLATKRLHILGIILFIIPFVVVF